jgi:hypothetical protein
VGGVEHRGRRLEAAHDVEHVAPAERVERRGGLVEDQQLRPVDLRLGDAEPLPLPAGEPPDRLVALVGESDQVEDPVDRVLDGGPGRAGRSRGRSAASRAG